MVSNLEKAKILTQALPFIKRYHGKTIVIKYGGSAMTDQKIKELISLYLQQISSFIA